MAKAVGNSYSPCLKPPRQLSTLPASIKPCGRIHAPTPAEYDKVLRDRGDIALWISQEAIDAWTPPQTGKRGAQPAYSQAAIETALTFRLLFHLALRQTESFLSSVLQLMGVDLPCPDHTTLSRHNATVVVRRKIDRAPQGSVCVIVDSSGLKVCGQGEWHSQKHGEKKRKSWKKLHIGVDDQGQIAASTVSESRDQDPSQVPEPLDQIEGEINRFVGDGIYDQEPVYTAIENHSPGAQVVIPPRKDAVLSPMASTAPTQRDQHLLEIERTGRFAWKRMSGYYAQSRAENSFSRFKRAFGDRLRAKRDESRSERLLLPASCSIGCWNLGGLSPTPSAKRGIPGGSAGSTRFRQQRLFCPVSDAIRGFIFGMSVGSFVGFGHALHPWLSGLVIPKHDARCSERQETN